MTRNIIAIDFGTSNSTVGFPSSRGPNLIEVEDGNLTIPSAIFFNLEEDKIQYGRTAIQAYTSHYDGRLLRALKSTLGSNLIEESTQIGERQFSIKDIIAKFLRHLKYIAETAIGSQIDDVVLGRPVWFVDDDLARDRMAQDQLKQIANACGFQNVYFQYEPIAAALDYESRIDCEELALVADIGGGTSDFSIVRVSPKGRTRLDRRTDVLASTGVHVGGTDFDKYLSLAQIMPHLGFRSFQRLRPELQLPSAIYFDLATWHRIAFLYNRKVLTSLKEMHILAAEPHLVHRLIRVVRERTGHQLAGDIESAKMALSQRSEIEINLPYIDDQLAITVSNSIFEEATREQTTRISSAIMDCVKRAGVLPVQIDTLFLTGGTSSIPFVRDCCINAVPNAKLVDGDKFGSVGLGLTIEAGNRAGYV